MRPIWRSADHVGEWKLTIHADTPDELFETAAKAVASTCRCKRGDPVPEETLRLESSDAASLLADWINELLGLSEIRCAAFDDVRVRVAGSRLIATVRGRRVPSWISPLKAATYHQIGLGKRADRWTAAVLCDI